MKLTNNFSLSEFDSKCGREMPQDVYKNVVKLAIELQVLRNYLGVSVKVTSGYRHPIHNANEGGAPDSMHIYGLAADIKVKGYTGAQLAEVIEKLISDGKMLQGGLGIYHNRVHYDIGYNGKRRRWEG